MTVATGLKGGLCPHGHEPITICDICLLRRADKVRLAEEREQGAARGVQGRRKRGNPPQGIQVLPIRFNVTRGAGRPPLTDAQRRQRARDRQRAQRARP